MKPIELLQNATSETILQWAVGVIFVLIGGAWAVFKFWRSDRRKAASPTVTATRGSVAAGRDIRESKIDIRRGGKP